MCLILFAYHTHSKYKLIVAANRDEFYERPTVAAHFWDDHDYILAGRDLKQLGTWLGVTKTGRFSALTNYRNPKESTEGKRSRGELVGDFLKENVEAENYLRKLETKRNLYPGYNLLVGDTKELFYYSNIQGRIQKLEPGIYGLSNSFLDTKWAKVERGKVGLSEIISENMTTEALVDKLIALLQNSDPVPDELLPNTGVSIEWEKVLSPIFIKSENYGTRSSGILLMSETEIVYQERVFSLEGVSDQQYRLKL